MLCPYANRRAHPLPPFRSTYADRNRQIGQFGPQSPIDLGAWQRRPDAFLELLELLQTQTVATGPEIATRLDIDRRTVRRYVSALQALGIPIEGQRGVGGGHRIRPGYRLPPLMLNDDDMVIVALGVVAAGRLGLAGPAESAEGALAKIHRVLPTCAQARRSARERPRLHDLRRTGRRPGRRRDGAVAGGQRSGGVGGIPNFLSGVLGRSDAPRRASARPRRAPGRWYLAAFDHGRDDLRTFRVDRMRRAVLAQEVAPPDGFDAAAVSGALLARTLRPHEVEVLLDLSLEEATRRLPATLAELAEADGGTLFECA